MIIARFGQNWAGAYEFGDTRFEDVWMSERPAVIQKVAGAHGVYDYYQDENYPVSAMMVTKRFKLTADTYAGIETALDTLRENTIATGRLNLWGQRRGGTSSAYRRWTPAKCISLKADERAHEDARYLTKAVELKFICPDGVWYGETANVQTENALAGTKTVTNDGNFPALCSVSVDTSSGTYTSFDVDNQTADCGWTYAGTFDSLTVSPSGYSVSASVSGTPQSDVYDNFSVDYPGQIAFFWLDPGANSIDLNAAGGGTFDYCQFGWFDTWLM